MFNNGEAPYSPLEIQKRQEKWLIIKLGALGDMVQIVPFCQALRHKHPEAHFTLLTTPSYAEWALEWDLFQQVWSEPRFPMMCLHKWLYVWWQLGKYDHIIDLQGVDRTRLYALGRSIIRISMHHDFHIRWRLQKLADSLGLGELPPMHLPVHHASSIPIPQPFVILVPGASKAEKCWPQACFAELAMWLRQTFHTDIVVIGRETYIPELEVYKQETHMRDIVQYGSQACLSVGNDTGPQLLAAAGGCPTLTFYSLHNPPTRGGPWGGWQLYSPDLANLLLQEVQELLLQHAPTWLPATHNRLHTPLS